MDKTQVRILFMILIGLMIFGQAIYEKRKKKPQTNRKRTPAPRRVVRDFDRPADNMKSFGFTTTSSLNFDKPDYTPVPEEEGQRVTENTEIEKQTAMPGEIGAMNDQHPAGNDEIRKAVIWSEILKRKY